MSVHNNCHDGQMNVRWEKYRKSEQIKALYPPRWSIFTHLFIETSPIKCGCACMYTQLFLLPLVYVMRDKRRIISLWFQIFIAFGVFIVCRSPTRWDFSKNKNILWKNSRKIYSTRVWVSFSFDFFFVDDKNRKTFLIFTVLAGFCRTSSFIGYAEWPRGKICRKLSD